MNIETLNVGDVVQFQYIDKERIYNTFPVDTQYSVENYAGKILCIRNLHEDKLSMQTIERNPLLERSQFLMTVQFNDGKIKSFYCGRVLNFKVELPAKRKSFLGRILDKLI